MGASFTSDISLSLSLFCRSLCPCVCTRHLLHTTACLKLSQCEVLAVQKLLLRRFYILHAMYIHMHLQRHPLSGLSTLAAVSSHVCHALALSVSFGQHAPIEEALNLPLFLVFALLADLDCSVPKHLQAENVPERVKWKRVKRCGFLGATCERIERGRRKRMVRIEKQIKDVHNN